MSEEQEINALEPAGNAGGYDELVTLSPLEHIRRRPGMYIGKLGDGSQNDDGIYVLLKETLDNAIDDTELSELGGYEWCGLESHQCLERVVLRAVVA